MAAVHSDSPIDADEVVRCFRHGLKAALLTSHTVTNPNRQFYRCPKDRSDKDHCEFFYWADELHREHNLPSPSSARRPSQSQGQQTPRYLPVTPRKRTFDSTYPLTPPEPTPSQKRKKTIEEALAEHSTPTQTRAAHSILEREEAEDDNEDALWTSLTPPSSSQKLKTRSGEPSQSYGSTSTLTDTDDPFVVASSQESQVTSTTYDPPGKGTELSPDTLLSALDMIPEYVRKLERKKIAAEKGSDAKAKRIAELEAEVEKLKERNNALKITIEMLASPRD